MENQIKFIEEYLGRLQKLANNDLFFTERDEEGVIKKKFFKFEHEIYPDGRFEFSVKFNQGVFDYTILYRRGTFHYDGAGEEAIEIFVVELMAYLNLSITCPFDRLVEVENGNPVIVISLQDLLSKNVEKMYLDWKNNKK